MKYTLPTLGLILSFSFVAMAADVPTTKADFCERAKSKGFAQDVLQSEENQVGFSNYGGMGGQGVCWWHSMFTRNAAHLTIFQPDQPRPDEKEVKGIISDIKTKRGVVIIPGYRNLAEFTRANEDLVQKTLESWQVEDGAFGFGWIRGLKGKPEVKPEKLKKMMNELYQLVTVKKQVIYQKLQMPGITAHAWVVVGMKKNDNGYDLNVIDSNFPGRVETFRYRYGDTNLDYPEMGMTFVPYTSRSNDEKKFNRLQSDYCRKGVTAKKIRDEVERSRCQKQSGSSRRCENRG